MVFPPIHPFQSLTGVTELDVGDLEFLSKKEFAGAKRNNRGIKLNGATGDLATLTANTGKDMYLARAKASIRQGVLDPDQHTFEVQLKANGAIIDTYIGNIIQTTGTPKIGTTNAQYKFIGIGTKVTTGQILKLEVITSTGSTLDIAGVIETFEVNTGASPT